MFDFLFYFLIFFPQFAVSQSQCGIHFCNFFCHDSPLLVYSGWSSDGPAYLVPYSTCSFFRRFASDGQPVKLLAVLEGTEQRTEFSSEPSSTVARCGLVDSENQNLIVARPSSMPDEDVEEYRIVIESLMGNQLLTNFNLGPIWIGNLNLDNNQIRHLVYNAAVPSQIFLPDGRVVDYLGDLDCFNVGPPEFGTLGPFNDIQLGVGGMRATDEPTNQFIQCAVADEPPSFDYLIGQQFQIFDQNSTILPNSVILNAIIGLGEAPFPFRTFSYVASESRRISQENSGIGPGTGRIPIILTPKQARICGLEEG